jgi:hypothetical protein
MSKHREVRPMVQGFFSGPEERSWEELPRHGISFDREHWYPANAGCAPTDWLDAPIEPGITFGELKSKVEAEGGDPFSVLGLTACRPPEFVRSLQGSRGSPPAPNPSPPPPTARPSAPRPTAGQPHGGLMPPPEIVAALATVMIRHPLGLVHTQDIRPKTCRIITRGTDDIAPCRKEVGDPRVVADAGVVVPQEYLACNRIPHDQDGIERR